METQETWKSTLGSVVRFLLGGAVAYLVQKGVVTASQGEFIMLEVIAGAITIASLVWAHFKNRAQAKLVKTALAAPPDTPLEIVKTMAQNA